MIELPIPTGAQVFLDTFAPQLEDELASVVSICADYTQRPEFKTASMVNWLSEAVLLRPGLRPCRWPRDLRPPVVLRRMRTATSRRFRRPA